MVTELAERFVEKMASLDPCAATMMDTGAEAGWESIAARLRGLPQALDLHRRGILRAAAEGNVAALRQVEGTAEQCEQWTGWFAELPATYGDGPLREELERGAARVNAALGGFVGFLRGELAPAATPPRRGRPRAVRAAGRLLHRRAAGPGGDLRLGLGRAAPHPRRAGRPHHRGAGRRPFRRAGAATAAGVPDQPARTGGIYYTRPSEDFARPGRVWWSERDGTREFSTWRAATTIFHEGAPGHHLQLGHMVYRADRLRPAPLPRHGPGHGLDGPGHSVRASGSRRVREVPHAPADAPEPAATPAPAPPAAPAPRPPRIHWYPVTALGHIGIRVRPNQPGDEERT